MFLDIGGNRELESVVALLYWLMREGSLGVQIKKFVVKSEKLFEAIEKMG